MIAANMTTSLQNETMRNVRLGVSGSDSHRRRQEYDGYRVELDIAGADVTNHDKHTRED